MQKGRFRKALVFVTAIVTIAIIALVVLFQVQSDKAEKKHDEVLKTYNLIGRAEIIFRFVSDDLIKQRSNILNPGSLDPPSIESRQLVYKEYDEVRKLVAENPGQAKRIEPLRKLVLSKLRQMDSITSLYSVDTARAISFVVAEKNKSIDTLRYSLDKFREAERPFLQKATIEHQQAENVLSHIRPILYSLIGGLVFLLVVLFWRNLQKESQISFRDKSSSIILEKIFEAVIQTDHKGAITMWNRRAEEVFGWTEKEVLGEHVQSLFNLSTTDRDKLARVLTWTGHFSGEMIINHKNGTPLHIQLSTTIVQKSPSKISGTVSILRDLTKRAEKERQLTEEKISLTEQLHDQLEESRIANQKLNEVNKNLEMAREKERLSISNELHDKFGNDLASIKINLAMILEELKLEDGELKKRFASCIKQIGLTCNSLAQLSTELKPKMLEDLGFFSSIKSKAEQFELHTGIEVVIENETEDLFFDEEETLELFRITEQALLNVEKHSKATKVIIETVMEDDNFILSIHDNGDGFIFKEGQTEGTGLNSITERAKKIGALSKIKSIPGKGTEITVILPLGDHL